MQASAATLYRVYGCRSWSVSWGDVPSESYRKWRVIEKVWVNMLDRENVSINIRRMVRKVGFTSVRLLWCSEKTL